MKVSISNTPTYFTLHYIAYVKHNLFFVLVGPLASSIHPWNYEDKNDEFYCDFTIVMFSAIFFPSMWLLLLLTGLAFIVIRCFSNRARSIEEEEPQNATIPPPKNTSITIGNPSEMGPSTSN